LDDHEVWAHTGHDFIQRSYGTSGQIGQRLTRRHQLEVDVRLQVKNGQGLV
jgi:hypothetical protein